MMARQLAEVEQIIARIEADPDLTPTQRLVAQRDTWREQAYQTAAGIRRIHRHLVTLRSHFATQTRIDELTHVIDEIVVPELVDRDSPSTVDGGDR